MSNLRKLILHTFLSGMCFDSFISSLVKNNLLSAFVFVTIAILLMSNVIKLYDKVKVNK
jgi:hypothetical protein